VCGDGGIDDLGLGVAGLDPGGEREPASADQDTPRLRDRRLGLREMQDAEVHRDRLERGVVERQTLRVSLDERESGAARACPIHHRGGHVYADWLGAARPG
jgi:hypothetical protein